MGPEPGARSPEPALRPGADLAETCQPRRGGAAFSPSTVDQRPEDGSEFEDSQGLEPPPPPKKQMCFSVVKFLCSVPEVDKRLTRTLTVQCWGYKLKQPCPTFFVGAGVLNSCPQNITWWCVFLFHGSRDIRDSIHWASFLRLVISAGLDGTVHTIDPGQHLGDRQGCFWTLVASLGCRGRSH